MCCRTGLKEEKELGPVYFCSFSSYCLQEKKSKLVSFDNAFIFLCNLNQYQAQNPQSAAQEIGGHERSLAQNEKTDRGDIANTSCFPTFVFFMFTYKVISQLVNYSPPYMFTRLPWKLTKYNAVSQHLEKYLNGLIYKYRALLVIGISLTDVV